MNHIQRVQDLGSLILGAVFMPNHARCEEIAESIASEYEFQRETPMKLRRFATGLRQLADAVDEQAVLTAEALAEIECAEPGTEKTKEEKCYVEGDSQDTRS